eukprot:TRINITY_DN29062_c0_g1_i1.p1 TRINITY_DN29062_c0_g1~~TRINITY_DN29062_c0_g1_i1.p1  ORF type:complete len:654 (-),score=109.45 TRINITY_DN29062_c0_g1_i1:198-2159(-)
MPTPSSATGSSGHHSHAPAKRKKAPSSSGSSKGVLPPAHHASHANQQEEIRGGLAVLANSRKGAEDPKRPSDTEDAIADCKKAMIKVLQSMWFDLTIAILIALNAIVIGIELSMQLEGHDLTAFRVLDSLFLVSYIVEISLRFFAFGFVASMKLSAVQFDALLIFLGALCAWVLEPIAGDSGTGTSADALGPVLVLRMFRLLRLGRTLRLLRVFSRIHEFWLLVRGFVNGIGIMMCTVVMFTLFIYVFSCMGVEIITKHPLNDQDEVFRQHVQDHFSNLPSTMLTLARFAVLDNTSEVYVPLVRRDPWLFFYFGTILLVISLIAFNLLSAVIFNSTMEQNINESDQARKAQEDEWSQLLGDLKRMFLRLDQDGSGQLSREEVQNIHPVDMQKLTQALNIKTPMEVFNALDVDGSGELSITEFFDGTLDLLLNNNDKNAIHVKRMEKQVETMHWRLRDLFNTQHDLDLKLDKLVGGLESLSVQEGMGISAFRGGPSFAGCSVSPNGDASQSAGQLAERLQKIWEESVQQTLKLTMNEVVETQTQLKDAISARKKKATGNTTSLSQGHLAERENSRASFASGSSMSSHSSAGGSSRKRPGQSRRRKAPSESSSVPSSRLRQDPLLPPKDFEPNAGCITARSEQSTESTRTTRMMV